MLSKLESTVLKKTLSTLNEERSKDERKKKYILFSIRFLFFSLILALCVTIGIFVKNTILNLESKLSQKEKKIKTLEDNLFSLQLQEQLFEEKQKLYNFDTYLDKKNFINKVKKNQIFLSDLIQDNPEQKGKNITRGNQNFKDIALTFDLGTGEHLKVLYNYMLKYPSLKVTIFLSNENPSLTTGSLFSRRNRRYIKILSRMNQRVLFGNHTWSHFNLKRSLDEESIGKRKYLPYISKQILSLEKILEEMNRVEDVFKDITGDNLSKYYRMPYGAISKDLLDIFAILGYKQHIYWSYNSKAGSLDIPDFVHKKFLYKRSEDGKLRMFLNPAYKTIKETLFFLKQWELRDKNGMNGAIILMHLGTQRKTDQLIYILDEFIPDMLFKGYRFVTVEKILNDKV